MDSIAWMQKVKEHREDLYELVSRYHPVNLLPITELAPNITAPNAERACEEVRNQIRQERTEYPDIQFNNAIKNDDCGTLYGLFQSTWFGVPESTDCWQIPGFSIAVDLLDDPPDCMFENND